MLIATVFALTAAVLHAGWNLIAKRAVDPFLALWGQFLVAGLIGGAGLVAVGGLPVRAWWWAAATGVIHIPYVMGLGRAYRQGDFSLAYPVARGGGALVAAIGGIALLGDDLSTLAVVAIVVVVAGMVTLGSGAPPAQLATAIGVAAMIGSYTIVDSHAAREFGGTAYVFAAFASIGVAVTAAGVAAGRAGGLVALPAAFWWRASLAALMSVVTYGLVLLAVRRAPVGYVAALRESSVLIAAVVGWRVLDEGRGRARTVAAGLITTGLVVLVASR